MRAALVVVALAVFALALAPYWAPLVGIGPPAAPAPGRSVEIGDGRHVNVIDEGDGPVVVLVHGRPGSAYDWPPLDAGLVAAGHRVIRYDRIGYGHSSRRGEGDSYGYAANARELVALLDALRLDSVVLVGWSYGGGVAQTVASEFPARVRGLVLVASVAAPTTPPGVGWDERILQWSERFQSWGLRAGFAARPGLARTGEVFFAGTPPPGWGERTNALLALPGAVHSWVEEGRPEPLDLLRPEAIVAPTVVIVGSADRITPAEGAADLARRIPGARLVEVPGGSHMLPNTHAQIVVEAVLDVARR